MVWHFQCGDFWTCTISLTIIRFRLLFTSFSWKRIFHSFPSENTRMNQDLVTTHWISIVDHWIKHERACRPLNEQAFLRWARFGDWGKEATGMPLIPTSIYMHERYSNWFGMHCRSPIRLTYIPFWSRISNIIDFFLEKFIDKNFMDVGVVPWIRSVQIMWIANLNQTNPKLN